MKNINLLYEAVALVEWDGNKYVESGKPYDQLQHSMKLKVHVKANFILQVLRTLKKLKHEKEVLWQESEE